MRLRFCVLSLACALPALTQSSTLPVGKPIEGMKGIDFKSISFHFHPLPRNCKDQPDHVFGKSGSVYDACIGGKQVCTKENVTVPLSLIADFDDQTRRRNEAVAESRRKRAAFSAAFAEARTEHNKAMTQHRAHFAERQQSRAALAVPVSVAEPGPAPPPPVADEKAREIVPGTTRAELIAKLGQPYMKITGDFERFTYLLTSGNTAKFELENSKVTAARIVLGQ